MIVIILGIGLILRLISLNQSFWIDEATTANASGLSLTRLFTEFLPNDFHPPLYYILVKYWTYLAGSSEVGIRSFSVVLGVATIYILYKLTKLITTKHTLVPALLLATSGLHIYYSQEARMYSLVTFLVTLAIYTYLRSIKLGERLNWIVFSVTLSLLVLTDYVAVVILVPIVIHGLFSSPRNKSSMFFASLAPFVAFCFWIPTFTKQLSAGLAVKESMANWWVVLGRVSLKEIALVPVKFIVGRISIDNNLLYVLAFILPLGISALLLFKATQKYKSDPNIRFVYAWLVLPVVITAIGALWIPVFSYFRLLFVLPAFYLLIATGLGQIKQRTATVLIATLIFFNILYSLTYLLTPKFRREDWRAMVGAYQDSNPKAYLVFPSNSQQEAVYYYSPETPIYTVENLPDKNHDVWLVRYAKDIVDPFDTRRIALETQGYRKIKEVDFNGVVVWVYSLSHPW